MIADAFNAAAVTRPRARAATGPGPAAGVARPARRVVLAHGGLCVAHAVASDFARKGADGAACRLLDRVVIKRAVPQASSESQSNQRPGIAPHRHSHVAGVGAGGAGEVMRAGALALSLGMLGCGGQSGGLGAEPQGAGDGLTNGAATSAGSGDGAQTSAGDADGMQSEPELSAAQFDAAIVTPPDTVDAVDTSGGAWRVIEVPGASNLPSVVRTPSGWMSLSSRFLGPDAKVITGVESALYRSRDGVHWQLLPLGPAGKDLQLRGLAYGAGRYVMVGVRLGGEGVVWASSDGEHWSESLQSLSEPFAWSTVAFVKDRFFAFGFTRLGVSDTGERWTALPTHMIGSAGAYGNGRYLLLGNGPMQTSENGREWQEHSLDCNLPGACITAPFGEVAQAPHYSAIFAEGRFFTEQLSSVDGASWEAQPGLYPSAYIGGRFLGSSSLTAGLATWTLGGPVQSLRVIRPSRSAVTVAGREWVGVLDRDAPLPETVDVPFEDGLTCENADCISGLLLVPPPGTPPLVDRVPRDAAGAPLLTRDCPVSSMLFCDDYAARSGCLCNTGAPRSPESCDDVSQYRCAGRFVPRPGEWQLDELAQGGCSCDAVDPNQPPRFGSTCSSMDTDTCPAPLECLGIDTPPSIGLPSPQPFVCTTHCTVDADCPSWEATGFCSGQVHLRCSNGSCQPRACD